MPYVESTISVNADPAAVYEVAKDMESYPQFMKDVESITTLERHEHSTVTRWVTKLEGRTLKWTERDEFDDENLMIRYTQVEGDLKKFEGYWKFEPENGETKVTLTVDFEFGIPMVAALLHPIAKVKVRENCVMMLKGIKEKVEGTP
jgi:coenzyme Q-binding protein COQ10